jgi:glycolate oxidase FAD binding subunit
MTPSDALLAKLEGIVGSSAVQLDAAQRSTFAIDDCKPAVIVCPASATQAADIVALAGREQLSLIPWGQGTQMHLGKAPTRYDIALSLAGLNRMLEYDEANLTVTAEAGMPLREMYKTSLPKRQFLPLGFPGSMASLGGVLTTNTNGVKRLRYGGIRDLLLGVRVALPDGAQVHFGGRVVKNVAGYDMNKLFIGSLGAFGVILETTYRLAALPEDDRILAAVFPSVSQATQAAAAIQASQLLPSAITLLSPAAAAVCNLAFLLTVHGNQVVLCLNFDGMYEAVERQLHDSQALCEQHSSVSIAQLSGEAMLALWEGQEAWRAAPDATDQTRVQIRLGVLSSHIAATIQQLSAPQSFCQQGGQWLADYSNGQIFVHLPLDDPERAADGMVSGWLRDLRSQIHNKDGYGVIEYAPAQLRRQLDIWGQSPGYQLLRLYKQHFDPHAVLNPGGRYVAGL